MEIQLSALHWVYLGFIIAIIGFMLMRRDTTLICIAGILGIGILATTSASGSVSGIFNSFIFETCAHWSYPYNHSRYVFNINST